MRMSLCMRGIALTLVVAALLSLASFGRSFGHELGRAAATKLAEDPSAFVVWVPNIGREVLVGPVAAVVRLARMVGRRLCAAVAGWATWWRFGGPEKSDRSSLPRRESPTCRRRARPR